MASEELPTTDFCDKLSLDYDSDHSLPISEDSDDSSDSYETSKCRARARQKHECINGRVVFDLEHLQAVPDLVYTYECLKEVILDYNDLTVIEEKFCQELRQLKVLSLMGNKLTHLPKNIHLLDQLEELFVDENRLRELPEELCQLSGLKRLHIQGNALTSLPEPIDGLKQLAFLKVNENRLQSLPEKLGLLVRLEELDLSYNRLSSLPQSFGSLESIRVLNLSHNDLKTLPDSFAELQNLMVLELSSNRLNFLSATLRSANRLQKLFVDSNELVSLPDWFGDMESIEEICLKSNFLRDAQLPDRFGHVCQKLVKLDISGNLMEALPESFAQIKTLKFVDFGSPLFEPERRRDLRNGNNIRHLPKNFGMNFGLMKELRLDENDIEELPHCFGDGMPNLEVLDLYSNVLVILPDSFCRLKSLRVLSIGMNCLKKLPKNFGELTALEELRAELNELKALPPTFGQLVNLRVLDLYKNRFDSFPTILKNLENIKCLQMGLQVSDMAVRVEASEQYRIDRLNRALKFGVTKRSKRTNFFDNNFHFGTDLSDQYSEESNSNNLCSDSMETECMSGSSDVSSGYSSLHASHDKVDYESTNASYESWDYEDFDPQQPYLHEPLIYPHTHRIQTPMKAFKNFIPLRLHPPRIHVKRIKLTPVEGQFDSCDSPPNS